ncbi:hypothetical protein RV10_GL001481 [Enterococcus pallens]|nr:hypothetical protein RV10_GL001481 [Enterococcus pallens]
MYKGDQNFLINKNNSIEKLLQKTFNLYCETYETKSVFVLVFS